MHLNFKLDVKALNDREFEGYGSVFNNMDILGDVVAPGAFKASLGEHKAAGTLPLMLWMHKPDQVAGAWVSMKEDARGLYVKGVLADTQLGNEARTLLGMKAMRGLSIGFRTRDADWVDDEERGVYRIVKDVDLVEVSLVSMAANPLAEVSAVKSRLSSIGEYVPTERECEKMLRGAGFSRSVTNAMVKGLRLGSAGMADDEDNSDGSAGMADVAGLAALAASLKRFKAVVEKPVAVIEERPSVRPRSSLIPWS